MMVTKEQTAAIDQRVAEARQRAVPTGEYLTVADLIEKLSKFPPEMKVSILDADTGYVMPVSYIGTDPDNEYPDHVTLGGDYVDSLGKDAFGR
ncbi:hypothetical protein G5V57_24205 [Nordella sp. HKS 07]|uniref:hypothetical protein n=1 Tax=Nordella sp. HKS 07 TaxID=2712222 RepID=UPI0013E18DF1|nr:hypothetical protein [Nordella sp. HKS 07]QIG50557.1 hypothetical protein G5V57_24205 [Nordella sp. HKS 07]